MKTKTTVNEYEWHPSTEEVMMMKLIVEVGTTYDNFYILRYGKHIQNCLTRTSSILIRHSNGMQLFLKDKKAFENAVKLVSAKLKKILAPRFKKGELVIATGINESEIMTVIGDRPFVSDLQTQTVKYVKPRIVVELFSSTLGVVNCDVDEIKPAFRKSKTNSESQVLSCQP